MIILAGKNDIACYGLELLIQHIGKENVVVVCNSNDDGTHSWQKSFKKTALDYCIRILSLKEAELIDADLFLSLEFDKIINPNKFKAKKLLNIHFSKLPAYKGMYTSVWPILNFENECGVTLHDIDKGIDTGDIYIQKKFDLARSDRCSDLYNKYLLNSKQLLQENLSKIINNLPVPIRQPHINSSYFSKNSLDFKNLEINAFCTAWELERKIYAYSFRVYQLPVFFGKKIVEIDILDKKSNTKPGTILFESATFIEVSTIDYDVRLYFDQLESSLKRIQDCSVLEFTNLLKGIAGVNDKNLLGWSPLIVASYNGNLGVVKKLLEMGANPNDCNYKRTSVLMYAKDYALRTGDRSIFELLLDSGAKLNHLDDNNKSIYDYISSAQAKELGI